MLYQLEYGQKRQDGCAVPRHTTVPHLLCIAIAERSFQKSVSACVGDAMLMRCKEVKVAGHGCLISVHVHVHVITLSRCSCVERWPQHEAGYARVQMTSSCVADTRHLRIPQQKLKMHGKIGLLVFVERKENGSLTTKCER